MKKIDSLEKVYDYLKKYDLKEKSYLKFDNDTLELKTNDNTTITILKKTIKVTKDEKQIIQFKLNYADMYLYLLKVMLGIEKAVTKKQIIRKNFETYLSIFVAIIIFNGMKFGFKESLVFFLLFISICVIILLITYTICKIFYLIKLRNVDRNDIKIIKQYVKLDFPEYMLDLKLELSFDYLRTIGKRFLKYPKKMKIEHEKELNKEQKEKINNIIKNRKTDSKANQLYEYYIFSSKVLKIISKYYNYDGTIKF